MKATLDLPDELMRAVKIRAVRENRGLKDTVADLLWRGLSQQAGPKGMPGRRVRLPLVRGAHGARPEAEMTPERAARVLLMEESEARRGSLR